MSQAIHPSDNQGLQCAMCSTTDITAVTIVTGADTNDEAFSDMLCRDCGLLVHRIIAHQKRYPDRKPGHVYGCQCERCLRGE